MFELPISYENAERMHTGRHRAFSNYSFQYERWYGMLWEVSELLNASSHTVETYIRRWWDDPYMLWESFGKLHETILRSIRELSHKDPNTGRATGILEILCFLYSCSQIMENGSTCNHQWKWHTQPIATHDHAYYNLIENFIKSRRAKTNRQSTSNIAKHHSQT